MNRILPLGEIYNLENVALDLNRLLSRKDNNDIRDGFPATFTRYTGDLRKVVSNLDIAKSLYKTGKREQFIIFAGTRAVGLSIVTTDIDNPVGVDESWPNISGFVCNPFRGQGLGRLSIETRMRVVKENFNNAAWTFVKNGNKPSEHLVRDVGFKKSRGELASPEGHTLYLFDEK
ncbi:MAG TPA: hypothetical protein PK265_01085 [Candidatus Saccharibacteria bacterium]|nr:hypothetical protein [Candidatus Saccharibacteria bacterium]HRQ97906.1 hypothetical protein [Candidatus Saccharibacteria bacterium]